MLNCPKCKSPMREIHKEGVMIDVCVSCRGVFLDAGELDYLLFDDHSQHNNHNQHNNHYDYHHKDHKYHNNYKKKKHMKSILGDLFDF